MPHALVGRWFPIRSPTNWPWFATISTPSCARVFLPHDHGRRKSQGSCRRHAPSDDMIQPMNLDAVVEFMQIDFLVGYDIVQDPKRPAWKPGDFFGETFS